MTSISSRGNWASTVEFTNFEVGIGPILSEPMCSLLSATSHCSVLRRRARRTFRDMITLVRDVGPSANSALIRYSSLRL